MHTIRILNISTIIPLKGLKRENDIVLRVQNYLHKKYGFDFKVAVPLPYVNRYLATKKKQWKKYFEFHQKRIINNQGSQTLIVSWIAPPSSNFFLNYILLPVNRFWFKYNTQNRLVELAKDVDLIISQTLMPDAVFAYWLHLKTGIPYILNLRYKANKNILKYPVFRSIFKNASKIITHSPNNYAYFRNYIDLNLILHPVDNIFFGKFKKDYNKIKLISVCRLLKLKHIDWVINGLAILQEKGYDFEYVIVGDGPELKNLQELAQKRHVTNKIDFKGYKNQREVAQLLKEAHVFVMPSFPETLGRSFLEAAASNCLCIGHEKAGVDGLLVHNESAIFVNKKTFNYEIEKIFKNFSPSYFDSFLHNAHNIVDGLTWNKIGIKYYKLYNRELIKRIND